MKRAREGKGRRSAEGVKRTGKRTGVAAQSTAYHHSPAQEAAAAKRLGGRNPKGSGNGNLADAIKSIEYATTLGVSLSNNSWGGGGFSRPMFEAIEAAGHADILFVAAAGNNGSNTDYFRNI